MRFDRRHRVALAAAILLGLVTATVGGQNVTPVRLSPLDQALQRVDTLLGQGRSEAADSVADSLAAAAHAQSDSDRRSEYVVLDSLTSCYVRRTNSARAFYYGERLLAIGRTILDPHGAEWARLLRRHAKLRYVVGDGEGAMNEGIQALALARDLNEIGPGELAGFHEDLAATYGGLSMFDSSRASLERSLTIRRHANGPTSFAVANTMASMAINANYAGDFTAALALIDSAVPMAERSVPPGDRGLLRIYNIHGVILGTMRDIPRANQVFRKCVDLANRAYGHYRLEVARYTSNVGLSEFDMGHYDQAQAWHERALEIRRRIQDQGGVIESLSKLAMVAMQLGQDARAESLLIQCADWERSRRGSPSARSDIEAFLFDVYMREGRLVEADSLLKLELDHRSKAMRPSHPRMIDAEFRRARLLRACRDTLGAFSAALKTDSLEREHVALTARTLSERQVLEYRDSRPAAADLALSLGPQHLPFAQRARLWDAIIRDRGQILEEMALRQRALMGQADPELGEVAGELALARRVYGSQLARAATTDSAIDASRVRIERLENRLAQMSLPFREDRYRGRLGYAEVRAALPAQASLVSFVVYRDPGQEGSRASANPVPAYAAFVQPGPRAQPIIVPLGNGPRIDSLVVAWRQAMQRPASDRKQEAMVERAGRMAADRLRRAVWDPVASRVASAKMVFIVPDGMLSLVNFAALPVDGSRYLIETGPLLHALSSERDLVHEGDAEHTGNDLLVVADPDFNADPTSRWAAREAPAMPEGSAGRRMRGPAIECAALTALRFDPLPATEREGRDITDLWRATHGGGSAKLMSGAGAGEAALKSAGSGCRIIHLATHGFFVDPRCPLTSTQGTGLIAENPLRLCGLALAGFNRRAEGAPDQEDGMLTAEEISAMDLAGVEWVVLSACDTGLGDIRAGEGVFGLRRAIAIAGARTTIMSLWPSEDIATRQWMEALYRARLSQKRTTAEAIRQASLDILHQLRARGASTHPSIWAAFVGAGDWR